MYKIFNNNSQNYHTKLAILIEKRTIQTNIILAFFIIYFLLGLYFYLKTELIVEKMENINKDCPNILLEKDSKFYLYYSNKNIEEGKNPIEFKNLDEYIEFTKWQEKNNIKCPILQLQYMKDTQDNDILQLKPSLLENKGGLPSNKSKSYFEQNKMLDATLDSTPFDNIKFNTGMYSGFDQYNQNIGLDTVLDHQFNEFNNDGKSRNPYDNNWGGKQYTLNAIERGDYKDREVYRYKNQKYINF